MSIIASLLWAIFTIIASIGQIMRNTMQKELTSTLGTIGATHVRFLFGLPFACCFLALVLYFAQLPVPSIKQGFLNWTALGAFAQIGATALMLATMKSKSFVVTTAYIKTEAVQLAIFGFIVLGDKLNLAMSFAILTATTGVLLLSWPKAQQAIRFDWQAALFGITAGGLFAISAIGFRGAIKDLDTPNFVVAASTTLTIGLVIQAISLTVYLLIFDRTVLPSIFKAWKPSLLAGFLGAFASQFWFLAFALETAAKVRTLALIEIVFAQIVSGQIFREKSSHKERIGVVLVILGCGLIL
jgi:drug/metabolite transporter (DMT)-like permease